MPNLLRVTVGRVSETEYSDTVVELRANVDDQPPESLAHATARLLAAGALDAWVTPILMKKGRPGLLVSALAKEADVAALEEVFFRETTTFGVRRSRCERSVLEREHETVRTPWGEVRVKTGRRHGSVVTRSPEYEDCARIAEDAGVAIREVYAAALEAKHGEVAPGRGEDERVSE
jgi:uncharacterized protein (DUF111 family)